MWLFLSTKKFFLSNFISENYAFSMDSMKIIFYFSYGQTTPLYPYILLESLDTTSEINKIVIDISLFDNIKNYLNKL